MTKLGERAFLEDYWSRFCARIFLLTVLPAILLLIVIVPPFQGSDEPAHFLRIVAIGNGQIIPQVLRSDPTQFGGPSAGGPVDVAAANMALGFTGAPEHLYGVTDVQTMAAQQAAGRLTYAHHSNTAIYAPIAYLPAALAAKVAQLLGLPILLWFYCGRFADAVVAASLLYWAIRRGGDAAPVLLTAAALPVVLFQSAVLTTDTLLLPSLLLFGAMLRRIGAREPMGRIDQGATIAAMFVIAMAKVAYLPFVFAPPAIAWLADRRWSSRVRIYAYGALAATLAWLGWAAIVHDKVFPLFAGFHVDTPAQVAFMLHHPGEALGAILRTMGRDLPSMSFGLTGSRLGNNDLMLVKPFIVIALFALVLSAIPAARPRSLPRGALACGLLIAVGCYVAVYLLLYLQFNNVGSRTVEGVQSRYLTPMAFLLLALTPRYAVSEARMRQFMIGLAGWCVICVAFMTIATLNNYWYY